MDVLTAIVVILVIVIVALGYYKASASTLADPTATYTRVHIKTGSSYLTSRPVVTKSLELLLSSSPPSRAWLMEQTPAGTRIGLGSTTLTSILVGDSKGLYLDSNTASRHYVYAPAIGDTGNIGFPPELLLLYSPMDLFTILVPMIVLLQHKKRYQHPSSPLFQHNTRALLQY